MQDQVNIMPFENKDLSIHQSYKKDLYLVCIKSYRLANKANRLLKTYKDGSGSLARINEHEEAVFVVTRAVLNDALLPTLRLRLIV